MREREGGGGREGRREEGREGGRERKREWMFSVCAQVHREKTLVTLAIHVHLLDLLHVV